MSHIICNSTLLARQLAHALGAEVDNTPSVVSWSVHTEAPGKPKDVEFRWPWQAHRYAFELLDAGHPSVIIRVERDRIGTITGCRTAGYVTPWSILDQAD